MFFHRLGVFMLLITPAGIPATVFKHAKLYSARAECVFRCYICLIIPVF